MPTNRAQILRSTAKTAGMLLRPANGETSARTYFVMPIALVISD